MRSLLDRASARLKPCKLLTFSLPLKSRLAECRQSLIRAGLNTTVQCEDIDQPVDNSIGFGSEPNTQVGKALRALRTAMVNTNHPIHRGSVYRKHPDGFSILKFIIKFIIS